MLNRRLLVDIGIIGLVLFVIVLVLFSIVKLNNKQPDAAQIMVDPTTFMNREVTIQATVKSLIRREGAYYLYLMDDFGVEITTHVLNEQTIGVDVQIRGVVIEGVNGKPEIMAYTITRLSTE